MRPAWSAFRTMMRAAARDPLWAFTAILFGPWHAALFILKALVLSAIVVFVLLGAVEVAVELTGLKKSWLHGAGNIAAILVGLIFLARFTFRPMIEHFGNDGEADTHGSARFATGREVAVYSKGENGLLIGRDPDTGKLLRYDGPAHLLTMAPTRTGKGVGTIIPNLLAANRSILCIDPKGENAGITAKARDRFGPVHILDPFGVAGDPLGKPSAAFNPLAGLDPEGLDIAEDVAGLADALVYDPPGEAGEAHWNEEAKALIGGIILFIITIEPRERRNLATLREMLTLAPDAFAALLQRMQKITAANGLIARAANRHLAKSDREAAGVLSSAQRHTHFLDSPRMSTIMSHSDF